MTFGKLNADLIQLTRADLEVDIDTVEGIDDNEALRVGVAAVGIAGARLAKDVQNAVEEAGAADLLGIGGTLVGLVDIVASWDGGGRNGEGEDGDDV